MARRFQHAESQPAQRQGIALLVVALVLRPHLAEQQLAALRIHGVLFVDIYRHVRVLLQQRPDGGGMVEVTVGQQDILQGAAALRHHALHLRRVVAGVDERADLCRLVAQQVAVGHDGPHL